MILYKRFNKGVNNNKDWDSEYNKNYNRESNDIFKLKYRYYNLSFLSLDESRFFKN